MSKLTDCLFLFLASMVFVGTLRNAQHTTYELKSRIKMISCHRWLGGDHFPNSSSSVDEFHSRLTWGFLVKSDLYYTSLQNRNTASLLHQNRCHLIKKINIVETRNNINQVYKLEKQYKITYSTERQTYVMLQRFKKVLDISEI